MTKKAVSTRIKTTELAKAMDGLLAQGILPNQIKNISTLLRLTFYYGLIALSEDPKSSPSSESIAFINQRVGKKKQSITPVTLADIVSLKQG